MKNNMTLREAYVSIGRQIMEQSENDFIAEVDADVFMENDREEGDPILEVVNRKMRVLYNIDVEYRSYGIKEINAINFRILPFQLEDMNMEYPEVVFHQKEIIDASKIRVERESDSEFGSFYPKKIELRMDKNANIIVEKSVIYF